MTAEQPQIARTDPDELTGTEAREGRLARVDVDKTARAVSFVMVVAVLGVCALLGIVQMIERGGIEAAQETAETTRGGPLEGGPSADGTEPPSDRTFLVELLPVSIDGFRTAARHDVPGFEGMMAEGIYTPLNEEISIRMPLNCYVAVRAPDGVSLLEEFERVSQRYPERTEPAGLSAVGTDASFVFHDGASYVIGWMEAGHVVIVDTRFTVAVPAEPGEVLSFHAIAVASAVAERLGR